MKRKLSYLVVVVAMFLIFVAAATNLDSLILDGYATIGSYLTVATYQTVGTYLTVGTDLTVGGETKAKEFRLGDGAALDSTGRMTMLVRNKNGDSLHRGRVVAWDTVLIAWNEIKILPNVAYKDATGIFDSEGGPNGIQIVVKGTPTQDSVLIYGTTMSHSGGIASTTEIIELGTTVNDIRYSDYIWTAVDSIFCDSTSDAGVDSIAAFLIPYRGVVMAIATSMNIAGVIVSDSILDNGIGEICIYGEAEVRTKTTSATFVRNGWPLAAGASGTALAIAVDEFHNDSISINNHRIVGYGLGTKDDVSDTANIWMFVRPQ